METKKILFKLNNMSSFTNEIKLQLLKNNTYLLLENFSFYLESENKKIVVEKGFITDGASIPKIFRFIGCPLDLPVLKGAIIHDWLRYNGYNRKYSDNIFLLAMRIAGTNNIKAILYYLAVRLGGYFIYKKYGHD